MSKSAFVVNGMICRQSIESSAPSNKCAPCIVSESTGYIVLRSLDLFRVIFSLQGESAVVLCDGLLHDMRIFKVHSKADE